MEYMFLDNPNDYFSYLLGNKLNLISFYVAYRRFNGFTLNKSQISSIVRMFNDGNYRASGPSSYEILKKYKKTWEPYYEGSTDGYSDYSQEYYDVQAVKNWLTWVNARNKISSDKIDPQLFLNAFDDEENCPLGAYERAIQTLGERKKQLSPKELKTWISNQDNLFMEVCLQRYSRNSGSYDPIPFTERTYSVQDCEQPVIIQEPRLSLWSRVKKLFGMSVDENNKKSEQKTNKPRLFSEESGDTSKQFKEDVEYQKATYLLYRGGFTDACYQKKAQEAFNKITEDGKNSYHTLAYTGLVRSMLRELSITKKTLLPDDLDNQSKNILALINKYLADPTLRVYREAFLVDKERLLSSYYSEEEFIKAGKELAKQNPVDLLHNLAVLVEQFKLLPSNQDISKLPDLPKFIYWWNNENTTVDDSAKIISAYNSSSNKNLWLVLLTKKLSGLEYENGQLKYADMAIVSNPSSPFFYSLQYYGNKIIYRADAGRAYGNIKSLLSNSGINDIAFNFFSDLITSNTKDINIALENMGRKVSFFNMTRDENDFDDYTRFGKDFDEKNLYYFGYGLYKFRKAENPDDDSLITFINFGLPIDRLYNTEVLKNKFAGQILTRAFVLGRKDIYIPLAQTFSDRNLNLALNSPTEAGQKFLIAYAMLKNHTLSKEDLYGLNIHNHNFNFGNNLRDWIPGCFYCHDSYPYGSGELIGEYGFPGEMEEWQKSDKTKEYNSRLLSTEEVSKNLKEKEKLFFTPMTKFFSDIIVDYSKQNPKDMRIPEAVHLLMLFYGKNYYWDQDYESNKYIADDLADQDVKGAERAFNLLKTKYIGTTWAKTTWLGGGR